MLSKIRRLKRDKDFERVFKKGRLAKEDFLILKVLPQTRTEIGGSKYKAEDKIFSANLRNSRFGLIVSSRVSKKAVVRNRIKRWLRAAIQQSKIDDNKIKRPVDIIVIVRPGKEIKNFQIVKETINNLFNKVKLWNF